MTQMTIQQAIDLGIGHQEAGRLQEAEGIYRQILAIDPNHADALHLLGTIALACGALAPAGELFDRAIQVRPDIAPYHCSRGDLHSAQGDIEKAIESYWRALALRPEFLEASNNLGVALSELRRMDEAVAVYEQLLKSQPDCTPALCNYSQALLGTGRVDDAIAAAQRALAIDPNLADAHNNLGAALLQQAQPDQALQSFERAIRLRHEFPLAHMNRGMLLLVKGDFARGWQEYAWRSQLAGPFKFRQSFTQPLWTGEDLRGRTILLHAEQGFGDTIQFVRYVPLVIARGARVILGVQPELHRLLSTVKGIDQCITQADPLPAFDFQCPFLNLPMVFQTTLQSIPTEIPYLRAPDGAAEIQSRLSDEKQFKVGLVWAGRPENSNDRYRSVQLEMLAPLTQMPNVALISLQKGPARQEMQSTPGLNLIDLADELHDFADTASAIAKLNLVITVDTAVAHLAGALGKPVWVLLPLVPDWRWLMDREDSPWYPSMRLFRQRKQGDWKSVMERVAEALEQFTQR